MMPEQYDGFRSQEFPVTCLICNALVEFSRKAAHAAWHNEGANATVSQQIFRLAQALDMGEASSCNCEDCRAIFHAFMSMQKNHSA